MSHIVAGDDAVNSPRRGSIGDGRLPRCDHGPELVVREEQCLTSEDETRIVELVEFGQPLNGRCVCPAVVIEARPYRVSPVRTTTWSAAGPTVSGSVSGAGLGSELTSSPAMRGTADLLGDAASLLRLAGQRTTRPEGLAANTGDGHYNEAPVDGCDGDVHAFRRPGGPGVGWTVAVTVDVSSAPFVGRSVDGGFRSYWLTVTCSTPAGALP